MTINMIKLKSNVYVGPVDIFIIFHTVFVILSGVSVPHGYYRQISLGHEALILAF